MEISEKKLEKFLERQRKEFQKTVDEEFQRHLGVAVETFEDQLKMVAEIVSGIQQQLIALKEMVAKNTEDIEMMKMDIEVIKSDIGEIKRELRRKVDIDEFETLEKRVLILEKKYSRA